MLAKMGIEDFQVEIFMVPQDLENGVLKRLPV